MALTKEQLEFRRNKIGASDAPIITGVSPYKTKYQLWLEKTTGQTQKTTAAMQYGNDNEAVARDMFERQTGIMMFPKQVIHPTRTWQFATLDGIDLDSSITCEIKCANAKDHAMAKDGIIPEKYYPQVQHGLECAQVEKGYYISFHKDQIVWVEYKRDSDYIARMTDMEYEFYEKHILGNVAPEKTDKDMQDEENEHIKMNSLDWDIAALKYKSVREELAILEKEEAQLKEHLIQLSGGKSCYGKGVYLTKVPRIGAIDYKSIPELEGVDLEKYRKTPVMSWRTTIQ